MKTLITLCLLILTTNLYARNYATYKLNGSNENYKCNYRTVVDELALNSKRLVPLVAKLDLSPNCLTHELRNFIKTTDKPIRGFFYGLNADAAEGVGFEGGVELVFTVYDRQTLMVGLVKYGGGAASVGLPVGASVTTGAIYGDCNTIDKYLGDFHNFSFLGFNKSFGSNDDLTHFKLTKCDSASNTDGLSMSLLGYSLTKYDAISDFVLLKGERAEEIIDFINQYHPI